MQDLPPPNGFGSISIARVQPKPIIKQSILLGILVALTWNGFSFLGDWRRRLRILRMEQMEHYIATLPFLLAEQERKYLIQLHRIRENERQLMKDVPGWKVGTLFGEPVYKTLPKNYLPCVSPDEFTVGRPQSEWLYKVISPDFWW
jgi:NADH dehydrogenase (ubiquinone) 1 alpha subcomplex subunit 13